MDNICSISSAIHCRYPVHTHNLGWVLVSEWCQQYLHSDDYTKELLNVTNCLYT